MNILLNGAPRAVPVDCTLGALVPHRDGVAAAVNGLVVRGSEWDSLTLREGDAVEVLTAFQGG